MSISVTDVLAKKTTWLLGKRQDGSISPGLGLLTWGYHAAVRTKLQAQRAISDEHIYDCIHGSVYLGGWPAHQGICPQEEKLAVLDVTCELPKRVASEAYLTVPVWDTHGE